MKKIHILFTLLFGVAAILFFGLAYPHHLHYQEQYQLFLFDSNYVWDIVKHPGGVADLLGRFCTQFFLYAWVGAFIIGVLLSLVQLLMLRLADWGRLYGLSFVPSFLLWIFLLDENALLSSVWTVLFMELAAWFIMMKPGGWKRYVRIVIAIPLLYCIAWPAHIYRNPSVSPELFSAVVILGIALPLLVYVARKWLQPSNIVSMLGSFIVVAAIMGLMIKQNCNFKAEKIMAYDFMATHQLWNRVLDTVNEEKPNNQIGVTVQNLALAMHGMLVEHGSEYNQNGINGLLPDVQSDATSPMPTAEAFYQLGMINVAQRTVFEAQEAILDFQKSGRCYKRLAETNLINGNYEVARKYLVALQKTLFYSDWANETLPLLGDEKAIAKHPEYGRLRKMAYKEDFYFSDHVTPDMLESLLRANPKNRLAYEYLTAYYLLTGDVQSANNTYRYYQSTSEK